MLLFQLTKGNANIQKIVAFENAFDKLFDVIVEEGNSDGGIVVEDCLHLLLNLLKNNPSNQTLFKEGTCLSRRLHTRVSVFLLTHFREHQFTKQGEIAIHPHGNKLLTESSVNLHEADVYRSR